MYSVKKFTGTRCNVALGRHGAFWQSESYDHWVRASDEHERIIGYVEANPVKAGLVGNPEDWPYSSASQRVRTGTAYGLPLPKLG